VLGSGEIEADGGGRCVRRVVIHDRHKGILQAINDIEEGSEERNRAAQWPDVHSR
jgi:hypothetical protein